MKKLIIATLLSTVLMFVWNAISWMILPVHKESFKYSPNQAAVVECLAANLTEDGMYHLPYADPQAPDFNTQNQTVKENAVGKPWAMIVYGKSMPGMSVPQFLYGILYYLIMSFLGAVILMAAGDKLTNFFQRLWLVMLIPIIVVLDTSLESMNWMNMPFHFEKGNIIDEFVSWFLGGSVLAFFVKKG
jgi:hypothetical protein